MAHIIRGHFRSAVYGDTFALLPQLAWIPTGMIISNEKWF